MRIRAAVRQLVPEGSSVGIVLLVALVVLVAGTGAWMIRESRKRVQAQILEEHSLVAELQADLVGAELAGRLRLIESYATRPSIIEAAEDNDWGEIGRQLERLLREDENFTSAALTGQDGAIRALHVSDRAMAGRESPYRDTFYRAIAEEEPFVSEAFFLSGDKRRFGVAFSARVEGPPGRVLGVLQAISEVSQASLIPSLRGEQARDIELFDKRGTPMLGDEEGGWGRGPTTSA